MRPRPQGAECQCGELIDRIATGATLRKLVVEAVGHMRVPLSPGTGRITAPGSSWPQSTRIVQRKRRPTSNVDSMPVFLSATAACDPNRSFVAGADIGRPRSKADDQVFSRDAQRFKVVRQSRWSIYCTGEEPSVPVQPVERNLAASPPPTLQAAETARSANRPTNDLTAYDLYLGAYAMVISAVKDIPEALRLLAQAIERDPRYGPALAWGAFCYFRLCEDGWSADPEADSRKDADLARRIARSSMSRTRCVLARARGRRSFHCDRYRAFPQPAIRPGSAEAPARDPRGLPEHISRSRCLLRPFGRLDEARGIIKRLRDRPCSGAGRQLFPQPRATRAVSLGSAPGDGRTSITTA
jgi:hypothetical protein